MNDLCLCPNIHAEHAVVKQKFPNVDSVQTGQTLDVMLRISRAERDLDGVATTDSIFVTRGALHLIRTVWSMYKAGKSPIFVAGAQGTGKSCAITLLAALIASWEPATQVYHLREYEGSAFAAIVTDVRKRSRRKLKSLVVVDQLKTDADSNTADISLAHVRVVMVASANIPHFYETRLGANNTPARLYYAFAASRDDCNEITGSKLRKAPVVPVTFDDMLNVSLPIAGQSDFYSQILQWSNFHLLTVKQMMAGKEGKSADTVLRKYINALRESVSGEYGRIFYLRVYDMFKAGKVAIEPFQVDNEDQDWDYKFDVVTRKKMKPSAATTMMSTVSKVHVTPSRTATIARSSKSRKPRTPTATPETQVALTASAYGDELFAYLDFRFVDEHGRVLSPAILQALERWLTLSGPPRQILEKQCESELNRANPSAKGFIIERLCLREHKLKWLAKYCCHALYLNPKLTESTSERIPFRRLQDVLSRIRGLDTSQGPVSFHFIPLQWNFRHIDALQIYTDHNQTLIIGNQITLQKANDHSTSLEWIDTARKIADRLQNPTIVLAFVSISEKSATPTVSVSLSIAKKWEASNTHVFHYPVERMVETAIAKSMSWIDEAAGIDGPEARLVKLEVKGTRKRKPQKKKPT